MKPKILLCLALVFSGVVCGWASRAAADELPTNAEPRYLDKPLSEWIPLTELAGNEVDLFRRRDDQALPAVLAIGTSALPWLLHWIRSDDPATVKIGIEGFGVLGPIARPAVPKLMRLINDWPVSTAWSNAIPALAAMYETNGLPVAMTFLLAAATNADAPAEFRLRVVRSIAEGRWSAKATTSVLVFCLKDEDWRVVAMAADTLGDTSQEPLMVVPALAACLASYTNLPVRSAVGMVANDPLWPEDVAVRNSAVIALTEFTYVARFREAMLSAVPVLVNTLNDEDGRVASQAANALGRLAIEPDLVVPALLKCLDRAYHNDPYHHVQSEAVIALGDFGDAAQAAVPALSKLAQTDPLGYVGGGFAAAALKKIVPQPKP